MFFPSKDINLVNYLNYAMKEGLTSLEIIVLVRELQKLLGARVEKIYQLTKKEFAFYLYKGGKAILKADVPRVICLTEYKKENPTTPSHFSMFLRKYLSNSMINAVRQLNSERIMEFEFKKGVQKYFLIFELFSKGNVILCDSEHKILIPLSSQSWRDRVIRYGEKYNLPPQKVDFDDIDFPSFKTHVSSSGKDIVRTIATMGLGGTYAEEICLLSNINKNTPVDELDDNQLRIVFDNIIGLINKAKEGDIEANVIFENKKPVDVQPFLLQIYASNKKRIFSSYNEALDFYFTNYEGNKESTTISNAFLKEIIKQEAILEQHKNYLKELNEKSELYKSQADFIYQHLGEVDDIIRTVQNAREKNYSWDEIISTLKSKKAEGNREAQLIEDITPSNAEIVLESGVKIDIRKSAVENANDLYTKSKKLASKIEGVEKTIALVEEKIKQLRIKGESVQVSSPKKIEKKEREWFEKFYWFFTSGGKLVIAGKDATQNEILIKKYLEQGDIVFHADVYGSPFAVMKKGADSTDTDKVEAATFTLCHSRAWRNKRLESVYWVLPEQVSKKAPSGEYIGRGAFMIYGRKNYIKDVELRFGVGVQIDPLKIISGPVENVRRKAKYYAVLIPGDKSKDAIAKDVKNQLLNVSREEHKQLISSLSLEDIKQHVLDSSNVFGVVE